MVNHKNDRDDKESLNSSFAVEKQVTKERLKTPKKSIRNKVNNDSHDCNISKIDCSINRKSSKKEKIIKTAEKKDKRGSKVKPVKSIKRTVTLKTEKTSDKKEKPKDKKIKTVQTVKESALLFKKLKEKKKQNKT